MPYKNYQHKKNRDRRRKIEGMLFINSFKKSCATCGFDDKRALDFHHRDKNNKLFKISDQRGRLSESILEEEIKKCVVLCANCHRILHTPVALL